MERSRVTVTTLLCVLLFCQTKICGKEIEMKVRPGDNITLSCDRALTLGSSIVWMRKCSHELQPSLILDHKIMYEEDSAHFRFLQNPKIDSLDLHITNITASDLGLYYCAEIKRKLNDVKSKEYTSHIYYHGNQTIRLSLSETSSTGQVTTISPPPVSDCITCWTLCLSICPVCVLFCLICLYYLCQKKTTDGGSDQIHNMKPRNTFEDVDTEVCYTSVNMTTRRPKRLKKQSQSSDFSSYAPVRTNIHILKHSDG